MILLPPAVGAYAACPVSPATTRTESVDRPKASAAMAWKAVSVPVMSTEPVMIVSRPSASRRQLAAAALALGQVAAPLPQRVGADALEALGAAEDRERLAVEPRIAFDDHVAQA